MAINLDIDVAEAAVPVAACVVICFLIFNVKSCSVEEAKEETKQQQAYLDGGCKKRPVSGLSGTHWVCDGEHND